MPIKPALLSFCRKPPCFAKRDIGPLALISRCVSSDVAAKRTFLCADHLAQVLHCLTEFVASKFHAWQSADSPHASDGGRTTGWWKDPAAEARWRSLAGGSSRKRKLDEPLRHLRIVLLIHVYRKPHKARCG
jgi:hypothetical protein